MEKLFHKFIPQNTSSVQSSYTSYLPLHIYGKIFGFGLFSISPKNFSTRFRATDLIIGIFAACFNAFVICVYYIIFTRPNFIQSTVKFHSTVGLTTPLVMFCQYLAYTAIMILSIMKRNDLCLILKKLKKIDHDLDEFRIRFDYRKEMRLIRKILVIVVSLIVSMMVLTKVSEQYCGIHIDYKFDIYFFWVLNCGVILLLGFCAVAGAIRNRFNGVNKCIR